jgi:hypothetical protein
LTTNNPEPLILINDVHCVLRLVPAGLEALRLQQLVPEGECTEILLSHRDLEALCKVYLTRVKPCVEGK